MDLIRALKELGFTQQEAIIYIQLCKSSGITGYEAAKLSGISRSNAYAALSSLVDKGYAHIIEEAAIKYIPVSKDDLVRNARRSFEETIRIISEELEFSTAPPEPYVTIHGESHVLDKLKNIIESASLRVYLSCNDATAKLVEKELAEAAGRGLKVVLLSPNSLEEAAVSHFYKEDAGSIKVIADTKEVLAGTLKQGIYSKNATFVQLIRESFVHEIQLMQLNKDPDE